MIAKIKKQEKRTRLTPSNADKDAELHTLLVGT